MLLGRAIPRPPSKIKALALGSPAGTMLFPSLCNEPTQTTAGRLHGHSAPQQHHDSTVCLQVRVHQCKALGGCLRKREVRERTQAGRLGVAGICLTEKGS